MAAMMLMLIILIMHTAIVSINIIAAISWPPLLISQLFSPRLFKAALFFYSLAVFVWIVLFVYLHTIHSSLLSPVYYCTIALITMIMMMTIGVSRC